MRVVAGPRKILRIEDHLAPDEPSYRSRGEAQVGRLLDRYGLPFQYEPPVQVYDRGRYRVWHPDFVLQGTAQSRGPPVAPFVIEYAGMPDRPEYMAGITHKSRVYAANGIDAMFIYPQALRGSQWPARLASRIRRRYAASLHSTYTFPARRSAAYRSGYKRFG